MSIPADYLDRRTLLSFDGNVEASCHIIRPDRYSAFKSDRFATKPLIPRGAGLSYAAASFCDGGTSIDMTRFDRILSFDRDLGIVEVEAGLTLSALHHFLSPRGWYLPVQPGYGSICIGGCIAADVHGKNPSKDGNFSKQVLSLQLFHPGHGIVELSKQVSDEIFEATCGGYGLTGVILSAKLQARSLAGTHMRLEVHPIKDALEGATEMFRLQSQGADIVYSWNDFLGSNERGMVVSGQLASLANADAKNGVKPAPLSPEWRKMWRIPLLNRLTGTIANKVYYNQQTHSASPSYSSVRESLFPLEGREGYFRGFGSRGFFEYQSLVPLENFESYIREVKAAAKRRDTPIVLAAGKVFDGARKFLRFSGSGVCFAIDIPHTPAAESTMSDIDQILLEHGGIPNLIKDSRLPRKIMEAAYPEFDAFKSLIANWDPSRTFRSTLSERLGL
jgi:decaprenylphospho-beta-D-ribofuranose 2-oxidase